MINKPVRIILRLALQVKELNQIITTRKNNTGYYTSTSLPCFLSSRSPEDLYSVSFADPSPSVVSEGVFRHLSAFL
jgi:hypothetical protein